MASTVVSSGDALQFSAPAMLFTGAFRTLDPRIHAQYDVDRDGRFLVVTESRASIVPPITIVRNWTPPAS